MTDPVDPSPHSSEFAYRGVSELLGDFGAGRSRPSEVAAVLLQRIADIDGQGTATALRSVLALNAAAHEVALAADRRWRDGTARALEGIPVLVKDNVEVSGLPSCAGATSLIGRPAVKDAPLVTRLRDAGAVVLGTTNMPEWANIRSSRSSGGWSAVGGLTANPWALDRNAGGSSSGSGVAVAAGLAPLAVGTETDGSITCPCSLNGVAGIKPTVGAVPTAGVVPISASQDSPGPMARTVADVAVMLQVLAGIDGVATRVAAGAEGVRVGVGRTWRTGHPATDQLFEATVAELRSAGVHLVDVSPALPGEQESADELTVLLSELVDGLASYLPTRGPGGPQNLVEVMAHETAHASVELAWFGHDHFEQALATGGTDSTLYREARARNLEWAVQHCLEPALTDCDVLIGPTYGPAWKSDLVLGGHPGAFATTTMAPAIAGWPIATVPMGLAQGLPVGMGIVGRPGSEAVLLAIGALAERPARPTWTAPQLS